MSISMKLVSGVRKSIVFLFAATPLAVAQNSIQIFTPVDVRPSATGTGYGSAAVNFNSTTLNLTCTASPVTAVLSSTADGTGNLLVDNNINVTVTTASSTVGPLNVCLGGWDASPQGPFQNCYGKGYQAHVSAGKLTGQDPDTFLKVGIAPLNIGNLLVSGPQQVKIDLQDEGDFLSNSTLYLDTNCTQGGVTGPALVSGNPIPSTNPTTAQLSQDFSFNPVNNQQIGFGYDLTQAQAAGTLTIQNQTIPEVSDNPLDPAIFQSQYVAQTSFATSNCLIHSGELLPSGKPACKVFTLECKVGTGANAAGALCPTSTLPNEIFQDEFDGPNFSLKNIITPNGTFHEGIGFLMAKEGWTGGPCTFDPASGLQGVDCPQNLLSSFTGATNGSNPANRRKNPAVTSGTASTASNANYVSSGRTTHPNSTFITVAGVPEDLTTVKVSGQNGGKWITTSTATLNFTSQPPDLTGSKLSGAANFVASPILNISFGVAPLGQLPSPGDPSLEPSVVTNTTPCPTSTTSSGPATVFTPAAQTIPNLADGKYLLYYYAQDCAGTEELQFTENGTGNWSTSFFTYPINVDTVPPAIATGPTLSPAPSAQGTYLLGTPVTATYSCTDATSGVVRCGSHTFSATGNSGTLSSPVSTSTPGYRTFQVEAIDAAGNKATSSVSYVVVEPTDSQVQITVNPQTVAYPGSITVSVTVTSADPKAAGQTTGPGGKVELLDGSMEVQKVHLMVGSSGSSTAQFVVPGLSIGTHILQVEYSGDSHNPPGYSAPATVTVLPAP